MDKIVTKLARVYGIVQGVGFRPTVSRHAMAYGVHGSVCNKGPFVEIIAQGCMENVQAFLQAVQEHPPERAVILKMDVEKIPEEELLTMEQFSIIESEKIKGDIFVSPDIATCEKCQKELFDPKDRRYLHPFINCTCCGPRLTILDSMPYDRVRTSMASFPMCSACEEEYYSPETRRYDAQPVCCNDCGPEVYLLDADVGFRGRKAIHKIRKAICEGKIVAIKGIGGFHLCCDATNKEGVKLLRQRKNRPAKPFAVMMRDMDTVCRECEVEASQKKILTGHQKPIILLQRKAQGNVCEPVAPDNPKLGVMLPYAPIHFLLFDYPDGLSMPDCLVMTSANTSGAPICRDDEDARRELQGLCDYVLSHNRLIRLRADDSVMDYYDGKPYMIRRSRGYAPLPFSIQKPWKGEVLAIGGELKNTFCLGKDQLFYPSPYLGDMGDVRTVKALDESVNRMEELLETRPKIVACDLHPGYNTTEYAHSIGLPCVAVQHHYAHILSCMVENDMDGLVIGVSYDGTGYGTDGTIWGGEVLLADYGSFTRKASIASFDQVGGDMASKEGWRIAVSMLKDIFGENQTQDLAEKLGLCPKNMAKLLCNMAEKRVNTVTSTSAGRLFDGVSAILGIRKASTYEGEASCQLQYAAERGKNFVSKIAGKNCKEITGKENEAEWKNIIEKQFESGRIQWKNEPDWDNEKECWIMPTDQIVKVLTEALLWWESRENSSECSTEDSFPYSTEYFVDILAYAFHSMLASLTVETCRRIREESGVNKVALSGGVFQNTLLLEETVKRLKQERFDIYTHSFLPPNDGGICVGQAAFAMWQLNHGKGIDGEKSES